MNLHLAGSSCSALVDAIDTPGELISLSSKISGIKPFPEWTLPLPVGLVRQQP